MHACFYCLGIFWNELILFGIYIVNTYNNIRASLIDDQYKTNDNNFVRITQSIMWTTCVLILYF